MMRLGPADGPVVVTALPLLEEANRIRAVAAAMLRALAAQGVAGALPDLPGQGESLLPTEQMRLADLRTAFAGAVAAIHGERRPVHVAAIRSGALLDPSAAAYARWHLAPQDGPSLLRDLTRIGRQGDGARKGGNAVLAAAPGETPVAIAGNRVAAGFLGELPHAILHGEADAPRRVVRLDGDPRPADRHVAGAPPWRRAEPGNDDELAQLLAADIADWMRTCAAR